VCREQLAKRDGSCARTRETISPWDHPWTACLLREQQTAVAVNSFDNRESIGSLVAPVDGTFGFQPGVRHTLRIRHRSFPHDCDGRRGGTVLSKPFATTRSTAGSIPPQGHPVRVTTAGSALLWHPGDARQSSGHPADGMPKWSLILFPAATVCAAREGVGGRLGADSVPRCAHGGRAAEIVRLPSGTARRVQYPPSHSNMSAIARTLRARAPLTMRLPAMQGSAYLFACSPYHVLNSSSVVGDSPPHCRVAQPRQLVWQGDFKLRSNRAFRPGGGDLRSGISGQGHGLFPTGPITLVLFHEDIRYPQTHPWRRSCVELILWESGFRGDLVDADTRNPWR